METAPCAAPKKYIVLVIIMLSLFFSLLLLSPVFFLIYLGTRGWEPTWLKGDTITGPDGYTYCLLHESGLMQDPSVKLIRTKDIKAEDTFEELGQNCLEFSWLSIIRPANRVKDNQSQLYMTSTNTIVAIPYFNKAVFAYSINENHCYGSGEIDTQSPFMLIEKDTPLYEPDIFALILCAAKNWPPGCPRLDKLQEGLTHPNPEVNKLSKWLLEVQAHGLSRDNETTQEVIDFLIAKIAITDPESQSNIIQIFGYCKESAAGKIIPLLQKLVLDKNETLAADAAMSLGNIGQPAFPFLADCIKSQNPHIRFLGLLGFRSAGSKAKSYEQEIRLLLNDKDSDVCQQAELALESLHRN